MTFAVKLIETAKRSLNIVIWIVVSIFFKLKNTLLSCFLEALPGNLSSNFNHIFHLLETFFFYLKKIHVMWKAFIKFFTFKKIPR